jgi:molybdopterin-synthase adenylyltransferase
MMTARRTAPDQYHRYARQVIFAGIGHEGQERLSNGRVTILGIGALGTHVADSLVRSGVGFVRLVDRDVPDLSNLQRQVLFDSDDVEGGLPKAVVAANRLGRINPDVEIEPVVADVNQFNIEGLITDVDLVIDGSDNFELRYLLNDAAIKHGKPWSYGGAISGHGMSMTIRPGDTPCLRCIFPDPPMPGEAPTCDTAGVLAPVVAIVAAIQTAEALKWLSGNREQVSRKMTMVDVWDLGFRQVELDGPEPDCPACGQRVFVFLDRDAPRQTTELCGADAIQVSIYPPAEISFEALADRLRTAGTVDYNRYLLRFQTNGYMLTVFPDGRAIVKGTVDPAEARSVYSRFVGM